MTEATHRLRTDHAEFVTLFQELQNAVECDDAPTLQACWTKFENRLLSHIDAEEKYLLPDLETLRPAEVATIRAEHARFRSLLAELGVSVDLHMLRKTAADELLELLRSHARREDETLYAWADAG